MFLHRISIDRRLSPLPGFADLTSVLISSWLFALFYSVSGRPAFAAVITAMLLSALWITNSAKKKVLRNEPLVITDLALAWQVAVFPSLYLPFLPCGILLTSGIVWLTVTAALWICSAGEPVYAAWWISALIPVLCLLLIRTRPVIFLEKKITVRLPLTFNPSSDAEKYGPLGAAVLHGIWHLTNKPECLKNYIPGQEPPADIVWNKSYLNQPGGRLPNIFLIQAESFCDPRIFSDEIPRDILANMDQICSEGQSGRLSAESFGAYTLRTEYAVLTGISPSSMGTYAFYPYLGTLGSPVWSIAQHLRSLGYRTVCVHPFHRDFFYRNRAMPNMGFDEFITAENFPDSETWGPYISDNCVARTMIELMNADPRPLFCFAITMESHGPWLEGRLKKEFDKGDAPQIGNLDPQICRYLAHLKNADRMIGTLCNGLKNSDRPGIMGLYGDHLPNLPQLITNEETATPYFIWKTGSDRNQKRKIDIRPEEMGGCLLEGLFKQL